jgi:hypothetical protein
MSDTEGVSSVTKAAGLTLANIYHEMVRHDTK